MTSDTIAKQLPKCYNEDAQMWEISLSLTAFVSQKLDDYLDILENFQRDYLEPETALSAWLDYVASQGTWGELWSPQWTVQQKRQLLMNNDFIWRNRGNKDAIAFLFKVFGLTASLVPSTGFILRQTQFPGALGSDPFDYIVKVPSNYIQGTPEYRLISKLLRDFCPCWCSFSIVSGV